MTRFANREPYNWKPETASLTDMRRFQEVIAAEEADKARGLSSREHLKMTVTNLRLPSSLGLVCQACGSSNGTTCTVNGREEITLCQECWLLTDSELFNEHSKNLKLKCRLCGSEVGVSTDWVEEYNAWGEEVGGEYVAFCRECWMKGEAMDDAYVDYQCGH